MEITIKGEDKKLLKQVEALAKKLGLKISWKKKAESSRIEKPSQKLYDLMSEKARSGGIESIKDPIAWQREQRMDKTLH